MNETIKTPKTTLLSFTAMPLETVYSVWEQSKETAPLRTPQQIKEQVDPEEVKNLFRRVIEQRIPVGEHIDFIFALENISISWREQAVRHRIGVKASPDRLGADMVMDVREIPNLSDSSWWSQSMRLLDLSKFADNRDYRVPDTILRHPERDTLLGAYRQTMELIQDGYKMLAEAGIPLEDCRELIPLGAQHRMTWKLNIGSLQHIFGKRGCWILQMPIWGPIIKGMVGELVAKVDPVFGELVTPPCLRGDEFTGCKYEEENARRYSGADAHPVCSLHFSKKYIHKLGSSVPDETLDPELVKICAEEQKIPMIDEMMDRAEEYRKFWARDPFTGRRLRVIQ